MAFTIYGIENVSFGSFKNGGLLLILLFFYDIFWVFGSEVMVTVAKGLDVPIKFLFPKAIEGFSMLGLGDVVIPGAFIALALRFDYFIKDKKEGNANNYFNATFGSYPIALGVTIAVMYLFDSPQPALLYLVPGCLISLALVAIFKKQIDHVWIFSEE